MLIDTKIQMSFLRPMRCSRVCVMSCIPYFHFSIVHTSLTLPWYASEDAKREIHRHKGILMDQSQYNTSRDARSCRPGTFRCDFCSLSSLCIHVGKSLEEILLLLYAYNSPNVMLISVFVIRKSVNYKHFFYWTEMSSQETSQKDIVREPNFTLQQDANESTVQAVVAVE